MNRVPERATVDEKTVKEFSEKVARGEVKQAPRKARKKAEKRSGPVTSIKPCDLVRDEAKAIIHRAGSSYTRMETISETEVMVR